MKRYQITKLLRIIIQIIFFIFLPGLVGIAFTEIKTLFIDLFNAKFISIIPDCSLLIILSLSTLILGRFFCGWMCMFGTYNDIINLIGTKIFKIKYKPKEELDRYLKYIKYLVLILIILLIWTSIIKIPGASPWDALIQLSNPTYAFKHYMVGLIILLLITIGDLFIERFFCRYLCPLGAVFSMLAKLRILNIKKERAICGPCKACTLKCSMGIDLDKVDLVKSGECINCLNCTSICPKNNAHFCINNKRLNEYAITTVAIAGTTGLYLATDTLSTTTASTSSNIVETSKYADGTYTGTSTGYRPDLTVSVTISKGKITKIVLVSTNDSEQFFNKAWSTIKNNILSSQSTKVNTVSGATYSSNGIINAVKAALAKAESAKSSTSLENETNSNTNTTNSESNTNDSTNTNTDSNDNQISKEESTTKTYKDGTYVGSASGYRSTITVNVTISNNKITSITLVSANDSPRQWTEAWNYIPNNIINSNSTKVNVVSGATYSSNGIIEAVNNALSQAEY